MAWSIFAELLRRHPGRLYLWLDQYPTGSRIMAASRQDRRLQVSLIYGGGGLWVREPGRHRRLEESVWEVAVRNSARAASIILERELQLEPPQETPPSTQETLVPRVIAGFLCRHAFSHRSINVEAYDLGADYPRDNLRTAGALPPHSPEPVTAWDVTGGAHRAMITRTGFAVAHYGLLNLSTAYRAADGKLDVLINEVFGPS